MKGIWSSVSVPRTSCPFICTCGYHCTQMLSTKLTAVVQTKGLSAQLLVSRVVNNWCAEQVQNYRTVFIQNILLQDHSLTTPVAEATSLTLNSLGEFSPTFHNTNIPRSTLLPVVSSTNSTATETNALCGYCKIWPEPNLRLRSSLVKALISVYRVFISVISDLLFGNQTFFSFHICTT